MRTRLTLGWRTGGPLLAVKNRDLLRLLRRTLRLGHGGSLWHCLLKRGALLCGFAVALLQTFVATIFEVVTVVARIAIVAVVAVFTRVDGLRTLHLRQGVHRLVG